MRFLVSTKIAVVVMIAISTFSLIAAFIPQGRDADFYRSLYGGWGSKIILVMGFDSVFRQVYYIGLMLMLWVMLMACTLRRLISEIRASKTKFIGSLESLRGLPCYHQVRLDLDREETTLHIVDILKRRLYRTKVKTESNSDLVYGSKHGLGRYGSITLHLGLALLVVGGIVMARFGERFSVELHVGESLDVEAERSETLTVTLNDFQVEFDREGKPLDYFCELEVFGPTSERSWKTVGVNKPFKQSGIEIYLESYRSDRSRAAGYVVSVIGKNGDLLASGLYVPCDRYVEVEDLGLALSAEQALIPVIRAIDQDGYLRSYPLYGDLAQATSDSLPIRFVMIHSVPSTAVRLQVVREPGQFVVILGLYLVAMGGFISLCLSHRQIWFIVSDEKVATSVAFGGYSNKDRQGFVRDFEAIKATINELL